MYGRFNRLVYIGFALLTVVFLTGCDQSDDLVADAGLTEITLSPAYLPALPDGYCYEFWVVDTLYDGHSLGKFNWDRVNKSFLDTDGEVIDNIFSINVDILNDFYLFTAVSVETIPDTDPDLPGPIMLMDMIADPDDRPINLEFPIDYGEGAVVYCLQTPTDRNSLSNNSGGVWFGYYEYLGVTLNDTTNVIVRGGYSDRIPDTATIFYTCSNYDETLDSCLEYLDVTDSVLNFDDYDSAGNVDLIVVDSTYKDDVDTVGVACITEVVDSNFIYKVATIDTFVHIGIDFEFVTLPVNLTEFDYDTFFVDSCTGDTTEFTVEHHRDYVPSYSYTVTGNDYSLDQLTSSHEALPDLFGTGWHYKGWVISPSLPDCDDLGHLTNPEWADFYLQSIFPNSGSMRVISTGSFKSFEGADDDNPYSMNLRVPSLPGEDFIQNLPCGAADNSIQLADTINGGSNIGGDIFITLEPDNYYDITNFPLILFTTRSTIPSYSFLNDTTYGTQHDQNGGVIFDMINHSGSATGNSAGFPSISGIIHTK